MDGWLGWTAEEWSAFGALIAAGGTVGALTLAVLTVLAAFQQVKAALKQVEEARQLRLEQARPYVAVFMEPSAAAAQIMDLVIRNFGTTAAYEVRVTITPRPQRAGQAGGVEDVGLPAVLPTLVPGQEWRTMWDFGPDRKQCGLPDQHTVKVEFRDSRGERFSEDYQLDWNAFWKQLNVRVYGLHEAAKALKGIDRAVKEWHELGARGLAVYVRDGDEKDRRARERHEKQRREQTKAASGSAEVLAKEPATPPGSEEASEQEVAE